MRTEFFILLVILAVSICISFGMFMSGAFESTPQPQYPTYTYNTTTGVYCNLMTTLCYSIALENVDPFHNIGVSMMFPNEVK